MMVFFSIAGVILFLCAYALGKHQGAKKGFREGKASMILELREQSLVEGSCFFCGAKKITRCEDTD